MANGEIVVFLTLTMISLITGIFFILRSILRYKDWRGGDKDELWSFIALILGGIITIIIGIIGIHLIISNSPLLVDILLGPLMLIGIIPIVLFTIYYFLKLEEKLEK